MSARTAPARRRPARAKTAKRRPAAKKSRRPQLDDRQIDLLGLGLVAAAVFFAFLIWLGWDGGRAGGWAVEGLRWLLGAVHYAVPVALMAAGAIVVLREFLPAVRPFRAGALCLFAGLTLALAAGTLGLGPSGVRHGYWDPAWAKERGGMVGEGLFWLTSTLLGSVGSHIIALFLLLAGALLLTGASVAGVVKATSDSVSTTTRALRDSHAEMRAAVTRTRRRPAREELAELEVGEPRVTRRPAAPPLDEVSWDADDEPGEFIPGVDAAIDDDAPTGEIEAAALPREPEDDSEEPSEEPRLAEDPETDEPGVTRAGTEPVDPANLTPQGRYRASVTDSPDFEWRVPAAGFLKRSSGEAARPDTAGQEKTAAQLVEALGHFGVEARVIGTIAGPHITRYELRLAPGTKVGKVAQLKDDLAYALAASDIRILAPIPGKQAVGVEVPNARRRIVHLGDVLQAPPEGWSPLTVWLGKDVAGRAIGADLAKMPHLLVAGTTGAGKSGAVNAMLSSILLRATPHEVRMVLVDPKQVELNHYDSIPHLLTPVITSPKKAAVALQNLVREMEQRYSYMSLARTRSLIELNKVRASRDQAPLPYILCVIDELADLMMVAPADVEDSIIRIAQKARAVGIHLVLATQSPRVDVITGMIKANVPSRIAFAVSSQTDSRVILDQNGAEALLGMGDMLFSPVGSSRLQRIQGAFIDESEIEALTEDWRLQGEPEFREELLEEAEPEVEESGGDPEFDPDEDPLLSDAIRLVAEMGTASTSMLQRRLRLGYTRAGRLIDMLERRGVISGYEGSKPRQVLISEGDVPRVLAALDERASGSPSPDAPSSSEDDDEGTFVPLPVLMPDIGETLREARMRRRIDMAEVESATKIRAKYLRALENEEWDLLPGPTYVKTFLRSYADYLELDSRRLVDEYKRRYEHPRGGEAAPFGGLAPGRAQPRRNRKRRRGPGALGPILVVGAIVVVLLAALYALGKLWPGSDSNPGSAVATATPTATKTPKQHRNAAKQRRAARRKAAAAAPIHVRLAATGDVYVCLVNAKGKPLVAGQTLRAGERTSSYTGKRFRVTLGTNAVQMVVDGKAYKVAPSANPVGYELRSGHKPRRLSSGQLPACA